MIKKRKFYIKFLIILFLAFFSSEQAFTETNNPSQWVENIGNKALIILKKDSLSDEEKTNSLEKIFISNLAIKRISLFVLGPYRKNLAPSDSLRYFESIKNFISKVYAKRLSLYPSGIIKVTKIEDKGKRGIIVSSLITFDNRPDPVSIDWWIIPSSTSLYKVFDIRISGIWMAQEQRSTFTSFLSRNNGKISNLIEKIELQLE